MNLDMKMVMKEDEGQPVELTQRFFIKPTSDFISLNKVKPDNNEIIQINL